MNTLRTFSKSAKIVSLLIISSTLTQQALAATYATVNEVTVVKKEATATKSTSAASSTVSVATAVTATQMVCNGAGVNLAPVTYYDNDAVFVDLMKMSKGWQRPFGVSSTEASTPIKVNVDGYPIDISPSSKLVNVVDNDQWDRPATESLYKLSWDGVGAIVPTGKIVSSGSNFVVFSRLTTARLILSMTATSATNPVRNVKIIPVNGDGTPMYTGKFRQRFIDSIAHFSTLRFMDWNRTNGSPVVEWKDRKRPNEAPVLDARGAPYEDMIDLANQTGKDLWVNIPHQASNDYVAQMAKLFSARLNSDRTVYVEYTNEAWNSHFKQYGYLKAIADAAGLKPPQAYARRVVEVSDLWRTNFARPLMTKIILAAQTNNPWVASTALAYNDTGHKVDGLAIGAYFGWKPVEYTAMTDWLLAATPSDVIAKAKAEAIPAFRAGVDKHMELARQYGIPLLAYEGGQHIVGPNVSMRENATITNLFVGTNRHVGMTDLYMSLMYQWQQAGGGPFMFFNSTGAYSKYGSWGFREHGAQAVADAPKLKGVYKYCGWQ